MASDLRQSFVWTEAATPNVTTTHSNAVDCIGIAIPNIPTNRSNVMACMEIENPNIPINRSNVMACMEIENLNIPIKRSNVMACMEKTTANIPTKRLKSHVMACIEIVDQSVATTQSNVLGCIEVATPNILRKRLDIMTSAEINPPKIVTPPSRAPDAFIWKEMGTLPIPTPAQMFPPVYVRKEVREYVPYDPEEIIYIQSMPREGFEWTSEDDWFTNLVEQNPFKDAIEIV
jgi:hypothetical protein